jgi:hypothetical protein
MLRPRSATSLLNITDLLCRLAFEAKRYLPPHFHRAGGRAIERTEQQTRHFVNIEIKADDRMGATARHKATLIDFDHSLSSYFSRKGAKKIFKPLREKRPLS